MRTILNILHEAFYKEAPFRLNGRPIAFLRMITIVGLYRHIVEKDERRQGQFYRWITTFVRDLGGWIVFDTMGDEQISRGTKLFHEGKISESVYLQTHDYNYNYIFSISEWLKGSGHRRKFSKIRRWCMYLMVLYVRWIFLFEYIRRGSILQRLFYFVVLKLCGFFLVSIPVASMFLAFRQAHSLIEYLLLPIVVPMLFGSSVVIYYCRQKTINWFWQRIMNNDHEKGVFS